MWPSGGADAEGRLARMTFGGRRRAVAPVRVAAMRDPRTSPRGKATGRVRRQARRAARAVERATGRPAARDRQRTWETCAGARATARSASSELRRTLMATAAVTPDPAAVGTSARGAGQLPAA